MYDHLKPLRQSRINLTGPERELRMIPPGGGALRAKVHYNRMLHLGNLCVPHGRSTIKGSEGGGAREA